MALTYGTAGGGAYHDRIYRASGHPQALYAAFPLPLHAGDESALA